VPAIGWRAKKLCIRGAKRVMAATRSRAAWGGGDRASHPTVASSFSNWNAACSARTGLPATIGWPNHKWQERGALLPVLGRVNHVETLYRTDNAALARKLLERYKGRDVYLGALERERNGPGAGATLARLAALVFDAPRSASMPLSRPATARLLIDELAGAGKIVLPGRRGTTVSCGEGRVSLPRA
jgi:hypothetical protein